MYHQHGTNRCHCHACDGNDQDYYLLESGLAALPSGQYVSSQWVPTPHDLEYAYAQMLTAVQPPRRPRLACRDRSGGGGGRWFAHGVLVLGLDELDELARNIWASLQADAAWAGHLPPWTELVRAVRLLVLAHELGHELNRHGYQSPHDDHREAAADYWAGWLAGRLSFASIALGTRVFAAIGCNQRHCTHPPSAKRAAAFRDGYAAGVPVAQTASRATANSQPSSGLAAVAAVGLGALAVAGLVAGLASLLDGNTGGRYR